MIRHRASELAFAILAALATMTHPAQAARLDYTFDAGLEYNDNISLVETDTVEGTIFRAGSGFALTEDTPTFRTNVTGRVDYRHYDQTFDDSVEGALSGRADWIAIPERLTFTVEDVLSLEPISTFEPNAPDNRQQVNIFSIGPTLDIGLRGAYSGEVELRYIDTDAEVTEEFNSKRLDLTARASRDLGTTSQVAANLHAQRVDFDDSSAVRNYDRFDLFSRYEKRSNKFRLGLNAGYTTLDFEAAGDHSGPLLQVDASWIPSDRHTVTVTLADHLSDVATDALATEPGGPAPDSVVVGDTVVTAAPYKERRLGVDYIHTRTIATLHLETYVHKLNYIELDTFDQKGHGARAALTWLLAPRTTLGAFAAIDVVKYERIRFETDTRRYGLTWLHEMSRRLSAYVELNHYDRRAIEQGDGAMQNSIYIALVYTR